MSRRPHSSHSLRRFAAVITGRHAARAALAICAALALAPATAQAQFQLGLQDNGLNVESGAATTAAYKTLQSVRGSIVRLSVYWASTAPSVLPAGFQASNPADPHYNWAATDAAVRAAAAHNEQVMLVPFDAPSWAEGPGRPNDPNVHSGAWDPNPSAYEAFTAAAARRYSGTFPDPLHPGAALPQVKLWEIWNEENLPWYLAAPDLIDEYRDLLNAGYASIKAVNPANQVAVGGLAPVSFLPPRSVSPLLFAAQLFCLSEAGSGFTRSASCPVAAEFDAFGFHPYSPAATPTKHAYNYNDVLVGDMNKISAVVNAADRLGTVAPRIQHQIWVTEFAWLTHPPNPAGDSLRTSGRYVAYSMYEIWRSGAQMVIWQNIRDISNELPVGGGLYTLQGAPKPSLYAFAFPFIAAVHRGRGLAWGRAPVSGRVAVVIQRKSGGRWIRVARTFTGADGVFQVRFKARGNALYRARLATGELSLAYNSKPIPPKRTHLHSG